MATRTNTAHPCYGMICTYPTGMLSVFFTFLCKNICSRSTSKDLRPKTYQGISIVQQRELEDMRRLILLFTVGYNFQMQSLLVLIHV